MKTTTAMVTAPRRIEYVQQELPPLGAHDVLVKMDSVGLCHTDLPRYLCQQAFTVSPRGYRMVEPVVPPCTLGHEPVGTVLEVGSAVTRFRAGDHVSGNFDAAFTTHRIVPDSAVLFKLPDMDIDYRLCVAEPLGCVMNMLNHVNQDSVEYVGVVGCGVMGLMTIAGLRASGAKEIVAIDVVDEKLELARQYGATAAVNSLKSNLVDQVYALTGGKFLDAVVEITGSLRGLQSACSVIKFPREGGLLHNPFLGRGRILISSVYTKEETFPMSLGNELVLRAPILDAAHPAAGRDILQNDMDAVDALLSGLIPMDRMITHTVPFQKLSEGFDWLLKPPAGYLKGVVLFD